MQIASQPVEWQTNLAHSYTAPRSFHRPLQKEAVQLTDSIQFSRQFECQVARATIDLPNWDKCPSGMNQLKVVQLSDTHFFQATDPAGEQELSAYWASVVQKINDEKPDVIVFTGDLANIYADRTTFTEQLKIASSYLNQLEAKKKFAIFGNHDRMVDGGSDYPNINRNGHKKLLKPAVRYWVNTCLEEAGFTILDKKPIDSSWLQNLNDPTITQDWVDHVLSDPPLLWENTSEEYAGIQWAGIDDGTPDDSKLLKGSQERLAPFLNMQIPRILLVHNPRHIPKLLPKGTGLDNTNSSPLIVLTGDTHNGHTHPLAYPLKVASGARGLRGLRPNRQTLQLFLEYLLGKLPVHGFYPLEHLNGHLYVNAGAGVARQIGSEEPKYRRWTDPEIAVFTLKPGSTFQIEPEKSTKKK